MKKAVCLLCFALILVVLSPSLVSMAASVPSMSVPSVSGVLIAGGTDADGSNSGNLVYEFVIPVKVGPIGNYGKYINGAYQFDLQPTIIFDDGLNSDYSLTGVRWSVIDYYSHNEGVTCTPGTNNSNNGFKSNVTANYQLSNMTVICKYFDVPFQSIVVSDVVYVVYRVSLDIVMLDSSNFAVPVLYMYPSVTERSDDRVVYDDMQQHRDIVNAIKDLKSNISGFFQQQWNNMQTWTNDILSGMSGFKDSVVNKFDTLFTFGRQWTDDIIDAIVGQSGGGGISSAQDELDDQLNSIEVVEQQLSDQVVDKIEVPSVSLNADETGGLRWVITTINSLYLSFNELHVMFACVVFFGIIAVLLFGRRNL